jgi:hypothetical protein
VFTSNSSSAGQDGGSGSLSRSPPIQHRYSSSAISRAASADLPARNTHCLQMPAIARS